MGRTFTIVAITGDTGMEHAIGKLHEATAKRLVAQWQERDNPDREPDGISYAACRIYTVSEWEEVRR